MSNTKPPGSKLNNQAYALFIGINNFKMFNQYDRERFNQAKALNKKYTNVTLKNLSYTDRSVVEFKEIVALQQRDTSIVTLLNNKASYINVVFGILSLAEKASSGDVVIITFSTHGISSINLRYLNIQRPDSYSNTAAYNALALHDQFMTEGELYALLMLFKSGVRVYVCFDCCEAGSWFDFKKWEFFHTSAMVRHISDKIHASFLPQQVVAFEKAFAKELAGHIEMSATVCALSIGTDQTEVIDDFSMSRVMHICFHTYVNKMNPQVLLPLYLDVITQVLISQKNTFIPIWEKWATTYLYNAINEGKEQYEEYYKTKNNRYSIPNYKENPAFTLDVLRYSYGLRITYHGKDIAKFFDTFMFNVNG